uniref:Selenoprotein F n=1 Tax=Anser brachyrhynchus TaxID=132585 RepID=A0A8B9IBD5_9AVES
MPPSPLLSPSGSVPDTRTGWGPATGPRRRWQERAGSKMALAAAERGWLGLLLGLQAVNVYGAQLSSEACRELGFSSNLLCSSCNLLGQFNLNQLDPFCRQCCHEEAQLETRKVVCGKG